MGSIGLQERRARRSCKKKEKEKGMRRRPNRSSLQMKKLKPTNLLAASFLRARMMR